MALPNTEVVDRFRDLEVEYAHAGERYERTLEELAGLKATPFERKAYAILKRLAEEGPLNKYQIGSNRLGHWARTSLLYATEECERLQLIRVERVEKEVRGRGPSKYYDLTLRGIGFLLCRLPGGFSDSPTRGRRQSVMLLDKLASRLSDTILFHEWPEIKHVGLEDLAFDRMKFAFHNKWLHKPATQEEEAARYHPSVTEELRRSMDNIDVFEEFWAGGWFTYDKEKDRIGLDERWLNGIKTSERLRHETISAIELSVDYDDIMEKQLMKLKATKAELEFLGMKEEFKRSHKRDSRAVQRAHEIVELMKDLGLYPQTGNR